MDAFSWVGSLIEWIASLIPRLTVIRATHAGVRFVRGWKVVVMEPGLHVYWPIVTEIDIWPTVEAPCKLPPQTLETADDKTVMVAGFFRYNVTDIEAVLTRMTEPESMIRDIGRAAVKHVICKRDKNELKEHAKLDRALLGRVQSELKGKGVEVVSATLSDLAPARVIKICHEGMQPDFESEELE